MAVLSEEVKRRGCGYACELQPVMVGWTAARTSFEQSESELLAREAAVPARHELLELGREWNFVR